jgi:hypothetical protein
MLIRISDWISGKWWHEWNSTDNRIENSQIIDFVLRIQITLVPHSLNHMLNKMNVAGSPSSILSTLFKDVQDGKTLTVVNCFARNNEQWPRVLACPHLGQQQYSLPHEPSMTEFCPGNAMDRPIDVYQARETMKIRDHGVPVHRCRRWYANGAIIAQCAGNFLFQHLRALRSSIGLGGFRDYCSSTCMDNELEHVSWTADVVLYLAAVLEDDDNAQGTRLPFTVEPLPSMALGDFAVGAKSQPSYGTIQCLTVNSERAS